MKCEVCGKKTLQKSKLCEECKKLELEKEQDEDLLLYNLYEESLKEENEDKESPVLSNNTKKSKMNEVVIVIMKVIMSINILLFVTLLFTPWFRLGGQVTYDGFVQIPRFIATEEFDSLTGEEISTYTGDYVSLSPVRMVGFVIRFFDEYHKTFGSDGQEKIALLPTMHLIIILLFVLLLFIDVLSVILLLGTEKFRVIRFVKITSILNLIVLGLNILFLKVTYINMFAQRAISQMRMNDKVNAINMTSKGIAVNREFYPYYLSYNAYLKYAIILLASWLFISAVLTEIKRKWDYEKRDQEIKNVKPSAK